MSNGPTFTGTLAGSGLRFAIVVARFNEGITSRLLEGAVSALTEHGVARADITTVWVPGAFEIPLAAKAVIAARPGRIEGVVCLGAVIRGGTPHFDYVCTEASRGIADVQMETGIPCGFGLLTCDTMDQAEERTSEPGKGHGNKGADAALAALEMVTLLRDLRA
jgi:6,7-dimethyl-8-ribityllumazine synthase